MRRFLASFLICLTAFLYWASPSAAPQIQVLSVIVPSPALWQFAADFGNYKAIGPPPVVYVVSEQTLAEQYCPGERCALDGMYDPNTGRLFISVDAAIHRQDTTLVHELMHALQVHAGKGASECTNEREAYAAHNAYHWLKTGKLLDKFPAVFYHCPD